MQSGEASRCCQRILLFSAGRFPRSSCLMPLLQKSSSRTPSTGWKSTPNKAPPASGARHLGGGMCGAELPREPGTGAALGPVWFWHKPYFFFTEVGGKETCCRGRAHLWCHPSPVSAPLPAPPLLQPRLLSISWAAGPALFCEERCRGRLRSTSPSPHPLEAPQIGHPWQEEPGAQMQPCTLACQHRAANTVRCWATWCLQHQQPLPRGWCEQPGD